MNLQRAGYRGWTIGLLNWKGTRNSWKSRTTKGRKETYASMICSLKAVLIGKYLCVFSNSFLKFICCRRNFQIFPLLQTAQSYIFHTDLTGLRMFLHVLSANTSYVSQWSIVFTPDTRAFEEKMQALKKIVHIKGTCFALLTGRNILEYTLEKLLDTLGKCTVNRMQWACANH